MSAEKVSIIISSFALLVSVSSTILVSIINNRHQDKMFKKEFYEKRKCEVIENYLKCVGECYLNNTKSTDNVDIAEWISEIYMYAPKELWADIDQMNQILIDKKGHAKHSEELKENYIDFCKKFSDFSRTTIK